jgi:hypothetical protein
LLLSFCSYSSPLFDSILYRLRQQDRQVLESFADKPEVLIAPVSRSLLIQNGRIRTCPDFWHDL